MTFSTTPRSSLKIALYRIRLGMRHCASIILDRGSRFQDGGPSVTVFTANLNTRPSLQLMLSSLKNTTSYPNYRLWIADNGSTDGSIEFLDTFPSCRPVQITKSPVQVSHRAWLDLVGREVQTDYWVAVDSDMLFIGRDWMWDLIARMENDRGLYLLAAEPKPRRLMADPLTNEDVVHAAAPSSWLFCVRTSLWEQLEQPTFEYQDRPNGNGSLRTVFDTGAKLLEQMDSHGLRYEFMPRTYRRKYYHYRNMSWLDLEATTAHAGLKRYQLADVERRATRAW